MIEVTYGILNYNPSQDAKATAAYLAAAESLAKNISPDLRSEVYLIDQASQPELTEQIARQHGFHAITLRSNVGISRGINLLANMARGRVVSLVTSDVTFTTGLDDRLVKILDENPDIYQICPVSDNSSLDHQRMQQARPDGQLVDNLTQELTIQFWPRKVFDRIGYFDERWKACYENMDFALRAFIDGGRVVVDQGSFCHHELNMCVKSGARNHTYDGYIAMPHGFNQELLTVMWHNKWAGLERYINMYETMTQDMGPLRAVMFHRYGDNVYLPYVQEVGY